MAYRDGVGDVQTPYVDEYERKARLAALKELYREAPKLAFVIELNFVFKLYLVYMWIDYSLGEIN